MSAVAPVMPPPDVEALVVHYLQPRIVAPRPGGVIPVGTRLPNPASDADTVDGFCRVEAAGGAKVNLTQWDLDVIVHGYHPEEVEAYKLAAQATALLESARWQYLLNAYWIVDSECLVAPSKQSDPLVNLPRYRSMVSWRVTGPESNPLMPDLARVGESPSGGDPDRTIERSRQ